MFQNNYSKLRIFSYVAGLFFIASFGIHIGCTTSATLEPTDNGQNQAKQCVVDSECAPGTFCRDKECIAPQGEGGSCERNEECVPGMVCIEGQCLVPEEESGCTRNGDCKAGEVCNKATQECEKEVVDLNVARVRIVTNSRALREGVTLQMSAIAYNKQGGVLVDQRFLWKSEQTEIVSMNEDGLATGGANSGQTSITAAIGDVVSEPTQLSNYGLVKEGNVRVVVYNSAGKPVEGANIKLSDQEQKTDSLGQATATIAPPFDLHVFHKDYSYFSALQVSTNDLYIEVSKNIDLSKAGGVSGAFDFGRLKDMFEVSDEDWDFATIGLGFAGLSISGNLLDLSFETLLGDNLQVNVLGNDVALPSGVVVDLSDTGKQDFQAAGEKGNRLLWGLGGRFSITDLQPIIAAVSEGVGNLNVGDLLLQVQPLLDKFAVGIKPNQSVSPVPKIKDTDDINGNNKTDDLVPDYKKFSAVEDGLLLDKKLDQTLNVSVKSVPKVDYTNKAGDTKKADFYIASLAAVRLPGAGVVPLGFAVGEGKDNLSLDVRFIKRENQLAEGEFMVLTLCLTIPMGEDPPPTLVAANLQYLDSPKDIVVDSFLNFTTKGVYNPMTRQVSNAVVEKGDMQMLTLSNEGKRWFVVFNKGSEFVLPVPPGEDRATDKFSVTLAGLKLKHSMDELLGFNKTNMNNLIRYVQDFNTSRIYIPESN